MKDESTQKEEENRKEQYIQFLRGPITDLVKAHYQTEEEINNGLEILEQTCQAIQDK